MGLKVLYKFGIIIIYIKLLTGNYQDFCRKENWYFTFDPKEIYLRRGDISLSKNFFKLANMMMGHFSL